MLTLSDAQLASIIESTLRLNLWTGPVRSGKTFGSLVRFSEECAIGPPGNFLIAGKTERTVKRNVIDPLRDIIGPKAVQHTIGTGEVRIAGRLCYTAGAHNEGSQDRIRGMTLAGGYGDEITTWPESFWQMLLSRLSVPGAKLFGTTNPDAPAHWLKRNIIDRGADLDLRVFDNFRLEDNPGLDQAYVESLKAEYGPPGTMWYQRFILGRWVLAEGAIWSSFDREAHIDSRLPLIRDWYLAIDYGTTNPFVALLIGEGDDGRLWVAREWRWDSRARHGQLTDAQYSERLRQWLRDGADDLVPSSQGAMPIAPRRVFVDPSAASFIRQLYYDQMPGITQADNTVSDGLRAVNTLFGGDRLRIHPSCAGSKITGESNLVSEIEGYIWDPKALERGDEQPLKTDDHGTDALRYAIMGLSTIWSRWIRTAHAA